GQYQNALAMEETILELKKEVFGTEHPSIATTMFNFACLKYDLGQLEEANLLATKSRDIRRKALGEEHEFYKGTVELCTMISKAMATKAPDDTNRTKKPLLQSRPLMNSTRELLLQGNLELGQHITTEKSNAANAQVIRRQISHTRPWNDHPRPQAQAQYWTALEDLGPPAINPVPQHSQERPHHLPRYHQPQELPSTKKGVPRLPGPGWAGMYSNRHPPRPWHDLQLQAPYIRPEVQRPQEPPWLDDPMQRSLGSSFGMMQAAPPRPWNDPQPQPQGYYPPPAYQQHQVRHFADNTMQSPFESSSNGAPINSWRTHPAYFPPSQPLPARPWSEHAPPQSRDQDLLRPIPDVQVPSLPSARNVQAPEETPWADRTAKEENEHYERDNPRAINIEGILQGGRTIPKDVIQTALNSCIGVLPVGLLPVLALAVLVVGVAGSLVLASPSSIVTLKVKQKGLMGEVLPRGKSLVVRVTSPEVTGGSLSRNERDNGLAQTYPLKVSSTVPGAEAHFAVVQLKHPDTVTWIKGESRIVKLIGNIHIGPASQREDKQEIYHRKELHGRKYEEEELEIWGKLLPFKHEGWRGIATRRATYGYKQSVTSIERERNALKVSSKPQELPPWAFSRPNEAC
ncbi:5206_t:CDS:2, partial [Acaulospora colombiana]